MYMLAHVAFRLRNMHSLSVRRLICAVVLLALLPAGAALPALATLGILAAVLVGLIAYEALRYADVRDRVRHQLAREPSCPRRRRRCDRDEDRPRADCDGSAPGCE